MDVLEVKDKAEELDMLLAIMRKHEEVIRHSCYMPANIRLERILNHYQHIASDALLGVRHFRDDVVVELRAMSLIVDMALNAGTHSEKNARLRGMTDLLESAIRKLREEEFKFSSAWYHWDDVFRSDAPTRLLMNRIHELEAEVEALKLENSIGDDVHKTD